MMNFGSDSPVLARQYCPGCEPDADPFAEILDVHWCDTHIPSRDGVDDAAVGSTIIISGSAEVGGEGNRRWNELLHRDSPERLQLRDITKVTPPDAGVHEGESAQETTLEETGAW